MQTPIRFWIVADADESGPCAHIANYAIYKRQMGPFVFGLCQLRKGSAISDLDDLVTGQIPAFVSASGYPAVFWNHNNEFHTNKNGRIVVALTRSERDELDAA